MKINFSTLVVVMFIGFIAGIGLLNAFESDKERSFYENKELKQRPIFTLETMESGQFFRDYNTYFSDQFFKREGMLSYYTKAKAEIKNWKNEFTNKTESGVVVNGYYVRNDGWIMQNPISSHFNKTVLQTYAEKTNHLAAKMQQKGTEVFYFSTPYKSSLLVHLYPDYLSKKSDLEKRDYLLSQLNSDDMHVVDVRKYFNDTLSDKEKEAFYFKTDHHWNQDGAYYALNHIFSYINENSRHDIQLNKVEMTDAICISDDYFLGSWNRTLQGLVKTKEKTCYEPISDLLSKNIEIQRKKDNGYITVPYYNMYGHDRKRRALNGKEGTYVYAHLYTDDFAETTVTNPASKTDKTLVILKDSYFNPLFLEVAEQFRKVTILDSRHLTERSIEEFLARSEYDFMWFFYSDNAEINPDLFDFQSKK